MEHSAPADLLGSRTEQPDARDGHERHPTDATDAERPVTSHHGKPQPQENSEEGARRQRACGVCNGLTVAHGARHQPGEKAPEDEPGDQGRQRWPVLRWREHVGVNRETLAQQRQAG
ncbi:MAG: hypothetical protein ABIU87_03630 [Ornithinibacter sp.]